MDRAERDAIINDAIAWLLEEGLEGGCLVKFGGWKWDERVARALLEAAVLGHPQINLIPCLANMRANWIHLGRATARSWAARWRNWIKNDWDPLVSGEKQPPMNANERQGVPAARRAFRPMPGPSPQPPAPNPEVAKAALATVRRRLEGGEP